MEEGNRAEELLRKIQSLDENSKRKVLVVSTVVIMAIVVFVWLAYFNSIVMPVGSGAADTSLATAPSSATTSTAQSPSGPGFWHTIGNGFSTAWEGFTGMFSGGHQVIQGKE